jgi:hypothetical protein
VIVGLGMFEGVGNTFICSLILESKYNNSIKLRLFRSRLQATFIVHVVRGAVFNLCIDSVINCYIVLADVILES